MHVLMAALFEIWRFRLARSASTTARFEDLQNPVFSSGQARSQYFGNLVTDGNVEEDQFSWLISLS